ncbi:sigma 54-interacting transcriptional regulator [Haliangium ochraceum]|uniref:Sigma 54 interacting domain protein n=1 Tax=Haliangium ochraceum (strain DSM 14365 / JCM 11303 / SMP-2) TaxID=502025 RepID=D0LY99_HALO1|nr:sigma 54-interacting transcriptional regulator [Haliangium ochraceum]ACY16249.1 Sigma 54 interacting domain protein [Haliangium ochraceum DSM 14365]
MPSLRVQIPGHSPTVFHLYKKITSLGSAPENDIVLPDALILDAFAHILFDGQTYTIATLSRRSELVVNGKKRKKHKLSHEDKLVIGPIEMRFSLIDAQPPIEEEAAETVADIDAYRKLYEFSARLMEKHDLAELLDTLMDTVIEITNADKGFLILMEGEQMQVKVARNLKRENIADAVSQLSDSIVAKVIKTLKAVIISDAMNDAEFSGSKSIMKLKLTSVICVPLLDGGKLTGLIYVGNDSIVDLFQPDAMQALTVFAAQASLIIANALLLDHLRVDNRQLSERLEQIRFGEIIGTSAPMQQVFKKVEKVAGTDISVLITGETGTGKELIAREIHARSPRAKAPFVTINCGAIPENLLESELFGHVKGAFTGAVASKQGKFQAAHGGTLFLDEIGEMPLNLQVKLLRAIQEKIVIRVGETRAEPVDIRILTATNRKLEDEIESGTFREDLYYRLNVVNIHLPPLRAREEDVVVIGRYLLGRYAQDYGSKVKGFSPNATVALRKYHWPGNIREMENRIKKALVLAETTVIGPDDLGLSADVLPRILTLSEAKDRFQRDYINEILALNSGNRTKTARDLGVDPRTIFRHLEKEASDA